MRNFAFLVFILGFWPNCIWAQKSEAPFDGSAVKAFIKENKPDEAIHLLWKRMENHPQERRPALMLVGVYNRFQRFDAGIKDFQLRLENHPSLGHLHEALGRLRFLSGRYADGLSDYETALRLYRSESKDVVESEALVPMAIVTLQYTAEYGRTLSLSARLADLSEKLADHEKLFQAFRFAGTAYFYLGDYRKAEDFDQRAIGVARDLKNPKLVADILNNLAVLQEVQGRYREAIRLQREAGILYKQTDNHEGLVLNLGNRGLLYTHLGQYEKAKSLFAEALATHRQNRTGGYGLAAIHSHMAYLAELEGRFDDMISHAQKALDIRQAQGDKKGTADSLYSLGLAYGKAGKFRKAAGAHQQALAIRREVKNAWGLTQSLTDLSVLYTKRKRRKKARLYAQESLRHARVLGAPALLWQSEYQSARVWAKARKGLAQAIAHDRAAVGAIEGMRSQISDASFKSGFLQDKLRVYEHLVGLLLRKDSRGAAFSVSESMKARAFLDRLVSSRADAESSAPATLLERKRVLEARLRFLYKSAL